MMKSRAPRLLGALAGPLFLGVAIAGPAPSPPGDRVPKPEEVIGFKLGTDYKLADYGQILSYFEALATASDRVVLERIGSSTLDRPMVVAVISSPDNLARLQRYRDINRQLAYARGLSDAEARRLAAEGRVTVWIDGGMHSTEVAHSQHTAELAYWLATDESEEARRIRDNVVLLLCANINPDGLDIVVDWYRRNLGTPFETAPLPRLYHHYVGHDNNRDWYMFTQVETRNVARVFYQRWFPQIIYNHHQTGPFPGRIWVPPPADPLNPHFDPLIITKFSQIGQYMLSRFMQEGKPGVSTGIAYRVVWYAGYMTSAPQLHNMLGLFTETALYRYATPHEYTDEEIGETFRRGVRISAREPSMHYPLPWEGGWWRLRDAMDYMMTASRAVLDLASRLREQYLYDTFVMGRRQIARGERAEGGPFAYVIDLAAQHDPGTAVELLRIFRTAGVEIRRAARPFEVEAADTIRPVSLEEERAARSYPAGSYVIGPQAFRPFVVDLLEPKVYPARYEFPDGPPERPYDLTGYSLALQMGVRVDRAWEPFELPGPAVTEIPPPAGEVVAPGSPGAGPGPFGHALSRATNAGYLAVNRLLGAGARVSWAAAAFEAGGESWPAGTWLIQDADASLLRRLARELGLRFVGLAAEPGVPLRPVRAPRIGLYQSYVPSMEEGWTRWVLEQYGFAVESLHDGDLRRGELSRLDVIVLPDQDAAQILRGHAPKTMPPEYVGGIGVEGAAALKRFVEGGGWLVAAHRPAEFVAEQFGLPVRNALEGVSRRQFFAPGTLVRVEVDGAEPLAYGMPEEAVALTWRHRLAMEIVEAAKEENSAAGEQVLEQDAVVYARFPEDEGILADGWLIGGQRYLAGKPAAVRIPLGGGQVVLLGFRPDTRGQSRNTYKLLFNPLLASTAGEDR